LTRRESSCNSAGVNANTVKLSFVPLFGLVSLAACDKPAPEPTPDRPATVQSGAASATQAPVPAAKPWTPPTSADPTGGKFTLDDATKDLGGSGDLVAKIDTDMGELTCTLYADKAPITVANFVGLARGVRPFWDGSDWVKKPAYDGTVFHRIVKGFMIQGGSMNGAEETGYTIPDEIWDGAKHDRAGLLCMANRGKNTNSKQFFITDDAAAHLDKGYTIFGECAPVDTIHALASAPVRGDKATKPPVIKSITISRGGAAPAGSASAAASASAAPAASSAPSAGPASSAKPPAKHEDAPKK
jgi:peptidyl-prolyl cis-trans isomerase A (cyclophilin A)